MSTARAAAGTMGNARKRPRSDKPDISFKTANTPLFPTPQEYEEEVIQRTGHFSYGGKKLTRTQIITSIISILAVIAVIVLFAVHIVQMPRYEGVLSAGDGSEFSVKLSVFCAELTDGLKSTGPSDIARSVGIILGLALTGLLAGSCDILIGRIPINRGITDRFGFPISPVLRFLPSMLLTAERLFEFGVKRFGGGIEYALTADNFSLSGEGYTWAMWVTEAFYLLGILSGLFLLIEMFSNAGIIGMILRLPLMVLSNAAVILALYNSGELGTAVTALSFIMLMIILAIINAAFPESKKITRAYYI